MAARVGVAVALGLALGAGCAGGFEREVGPAERAVLAAPDAVELLALEPVPPPRPLGPDEPAFHGFRVLGRTELADPDDRARAVDLLRRGIDAAGDRSALCFLPRHGLRVRRGAARVDAVVCYRCYRVRLHDGRGGLREVRIAADHEPEMSALFRARGLTLAPP